MRRARLLLAVVSVTFAVGLVLHTLFDAGGWSRREQVRHDLQALQTQNDATETHIRNLRAQIDALRTRPDVQEREVRHQLGYVRSGDIVLDLGGHQP